jgi:hypothetical protein
MTSATVTVERRPDVATVGRALPWRWRALVTRAIALAMMATGLGCVVVSETQADTQFSDSQRSLHSTQHQMELALAHLASARRDVGLVDAQVARAAAALTNDETALGEVQSALARAQTTVQAAGTAITGLRTCLGGVEGALNALSVGDQRSAVDALRAVSSSCQGALGDDG